MNTRKILAIGALTSVLASGLAFAGGGHCKYGDGTSGRHHGEHFMAQKLLGKMGDKLDLNGSQREQIKSILAANKSSMQAYRKSRHEIRMTTMQLDPSDASYQSEVDRIAAEKAELARTSMLLRADMKQQVMAVLTEEQRSKLKEYRDRKIEKMQKRMEKYHLSDSTS